MLPRPVVILAAAILVPASASAQTKAQDALATALQQSLAAVFDPGSPSARLMLIETNHGVEGSRILWIGDEYREGWKLASVSNGEAALRRGGQTVRVGVNTPWPAPPPPEPALDLALTPSGPLSLSNRPAPAADRQAALSRAVANGQPMEVYRMNGSGKDIAQALAFGMGRSGASAQARELNALIADRNVTFNVNVSSSGTALMARRNGQEVARFSSPLLDMASPMLTR